MKILSGPAGGGILTNTEVREWLEEKKFDIQRRDVPDDVIKPPSSTASVAKYVRQYLDSSPSGAQTTRSVRSLFEKLKKFNLSSPELLMIANVRPEAYAHLTPLIANVYARYDEDQLYEILELINSTLEKRVKRKTPADSDTDPATQNQAAQHEGQQNEIPGPIEPAESPENAEGDEISAQVTDMTAAVRSVRVERREGMEEKVPTENLPFGRADATITDYTTYTEPNDSETVHGSRSKRTTR